MEVSTEKHDLARGNVFGLNLSLQGYLLNSLSLFIIYILISYNTWFVKTFRDQVFNHMLWVACVLQALYLTILTFSMKYDASWIDLALEQSASMRGKTPYHFYRIQRPALITTPTCSTGFCHSCWSCCQICFADDGFSWMGHGLLSNFESFCSQLKLATNGKQRNAPTNNALVAGVNSH